VAASYGQQNTHGVATGKAEVATRDVKFAKASDKYYTQQKGIVP